MQKNVNITPREQTLIAYVILAAATLAVFWQVNGCGFVFDDTLYVTENIYIRYGMTPDGFLWAFKNFQDWWMPLTWLSIMLNYHLFGFNPESYHLTNLILHV